MKKLLLAITILLLTATAANAQVYGNSIGLRIGNGAELSYQHATSNLNRFEIDLGLEGFSFDNINLAGLYQIIYPISDVPGMNWYVGYGAGLGIFNGFKNFAVGVLGNIGIEYNVGSAPISFSLDWRPGLYYKTNSNKLWLIYGNFAIGIRYRF
mgnify:CR=1 FL=1